jgi:hypothetical protein
MFSLLAAAVGAVVAATSAAAAAAPHPVTAFSRANTAVAAFAQDGPLVAWFYKATSPKVCNGVQVRSLGNGLQADLPLQARAQNVTCTWPVDKTHPHVNLALAGSNLLWTLWQPSPIPFDYLIGSSVDVGQRAERRFQEVAHTKTGPGLWLGGIAGDKSTLVYGVTSVDYIDEAGCLAGTATCDLKIAGGGVYRLDGRMQPKLIPGTSDEGAVALAANDGAVAYVPTSSLGPQGRPLAGADLPIDVIDAVTGASISRVTPQGTPLAIALTSHFVATLERTPLGLRVAWYNRASGDPAGSVPVSAKTEPQLTASDKTIVYRVGRSIRAVDIASHNLSTLARAAATPIGLSLEGSRLAWAENLKHSARIRTLAVTQ